MRFFGCCLQGLYVVAQLFTGGSIDDFLLSAYNHPPGGEKRKAGLADAAVAGRTWSGIVLFGGVGCGKCRSTACLPDIYHGVATFSL